MVKKCLVILLLLCFTPRVLAKSACSYQEEMDYNVKAGNVKVKYEIKEETGTLPADLEMEGEKIPSLNYIEVQVLNVTDDFYVKLLNDDAEVAEEEKEITLAADSDGTAIYKVYDISRIHKYTVQVFTSSKTPCPDERYKTYYLTTPRYNNYSTYSACEGIENYSLCNKFVTFTDISMDEFLKRTKDFKTGKIKEEPTEEKDKKGILYYLNQSKWYILGGLVVIGGTVVVIETKKTKKQRKMGL